MEQKNIPSKKKTKKLAKNIYCVTLTPERLVIFLCLFLCLVLIFNAIYQDIFYKKADKSNPFTDPKNLPECEYADNKTDETPFFDFSFKAPEETIMNYSSTLINNNHSDFAYSLLFESDKNDYYDNFKKMEEMMYNNGCLRHFLGYYELATQNYFIGILSKVNRKKVETAILKRVNCPDLVFEFFLSYDFFKLYLTEEQILKNFFRYNFKHLEWSFDINSKFYRKLSRIAKFAQAIYKEVLDLFEQYILSVTEEDTSFEPVAILYFFEFRYGIFHKQYLNFVVLLFDIVKGEKEDDNERLELREYFKLCSREVEKVDSCIKKILLTLEKIDELLERNMDLAGLIDAVKRGEIVTIQWFSYWLEELNTEYEHFSFTVREIIEAVAEFSIDV